MVLTERATNRKIGDAVLNVGLGEKNGGLPTCLSLVSTIAIGIVAIVCKRLISGKVGVVSACGGVQYQVAY